MSDGDGGSQPSGAIADSNRDYRSLTRKQRRAVDAIVAREDNETFLKVSEQTGISNSYLQYVRKNFPEIIEQRRETLEVVAGDGESVSLQLTPDEVREAMQRLPEDISERLYDAMESKA
jgi:hypothetical protein